jgi:hypothetical protein
MKNNMKLTDAQQEWNKKIDKKYQKKGKKKK